MTEFPALERALRAWVREALSHLADGSGPELVHGFPRWQHDSDGVFRLHEEVRVWPSNEVQGLFQLPLWPDVTSALQSDDRLRDHLGKLVGTEGMQTVFDVKATAQHVLPPPDEAEEAERAFQQRYDEVDRFLAASEIEYTTVWPIPGMKSSNLPVALEVDVGVTRTSDSELTMLLDRQVVRSQFPRTYYWGASRENPACLRFRYRLPKVIRDMNWVGSRERRDELQERLMSIQETFQQVLALIFTTPPVIPGSVTFTTWPLEAGWFTFHDPFIRDPRFEGFDEWPINQSETTAIVEAWKVLRQPSFPKTLVLPLRRLSYRARRPEAEDELIDVMIAAEALYFSDQEVNTELGFRLAVRAAAFCDPQALSMTKREVFDLMKTAYGARSKIVHGGFVGDLKLKGSNVSLEDFIQAVEAVVRQAVKEALSRLASLDPRWPPDWNDLTLPK
jgi:hypothetical protein